MEVLLHPGDSTWNIFKDGLFIQVFNSILTKQGIPASLGVSALKDLDVNSLAVNRKAKEAIGGIARLTQDNGKARTSPQFPCLRNCICHFKHFVCENPPS